ncbi:50S ribosomal protein L23 [Candidatus Saccharibacteria bacterium]|nr:50S ribosomal protein L23 [Candidatus Saccharibacteria bacterium]
MATKAKTTAKVKKVEEKATPSILSAPRVTEKTYSAQVNRTYVFEVPAKASKQAIAKAVEEEHKVTVTSVRVLIRKGKKTRYSRGKHAYPGTTYRQDKKFAYVTVKEGDKIKVEAFEEAAKELEKSAKTEEKAKKSSEKKGDKK